jgi:hypothetical protein
LCRNTSPRPGFLGAKPSAAEIAQKKAKYLAYARRVSYLMQGKSEAEGAESWIEEQLKKVGVGKGKPGRVQSVLGGAFLRMYLDGKKDPSVIAQAGVEIGQSPEFKHLTEELASYLQNEISRQHLAKVSPDDIRRMADRHLKAVKTKSGIAFRYTLNAVIGGVTGVAVNQVSDLGDTVSANGTASKFEIEITLSDTYDFQNKRSGEYEHYRQKLARLLLANEFDKFDEAYEGEVHYPIDISTHKTHLDNAAVFASFMFALEKKKWTPGGLAWDVTVPAEVTLVFHQSRAKAHTAHAH